MKKIGIVLVLFIAVLIAVYLILSFAVPGMRITLDAAPTEYFVQSISHMSFFKMMVSLAAAVIFSAIPMIFWKKK